MTIPPSPRLHFLPQQRRASLCTRPPLSLSFSFHFTCVEHAYFSTLYISPSPLLSSSPIPSSSPLLLLHPQHTPTGDSSYLQRHNLTSERCVSTSFIAPQPVVITSPSWNLRLGEMYSSTSLAPPSPSLKASHALQSNSH